MRGPATRIASFGETVFATYSKLARDLGAIDLGQGVPSEGPPPFVLDALVEAAREGQQYAPMAGLPALVQEIAFDHGRWLGRGLDPIDNVQTTVGATEGLFATMQAFVEPGDEVVLFEPFYDAYPADVTMAGGVPIVVPLEPDASGRWTFDPERLRAVLSPRTRMIVVNTPHNPTGTVFTPEELDLIVEAATTVDALILSDEAYEHLAFDGTTRLASRPGAWERSITLSSFGKSFSVTGWKVGWAIGPSTLVRSIRMAHQWIPFTVATPLQVAAAKALTVARADDDAYWRELRTRLRESAATLVEALSASPLRATMPQGGYFVMADASNLDYDDDVALCLDLPSRVGVGAIPPSAFFTDAHRSRAARYVRLAFCKPRDQLEEAGRRLARLTPRRREDTNGTGADA